LCGSSHFCGSVKRMATPAERFPGAELFVDSEGQLDEYARRAFWRVQADLMYLSLRPHTPRLEAAQQVCERFGHDQRGPGCQRCGARVV
jgi:hypothetical protein